MRRRHSLGDASSSATADLFIGLMVAVLLILVALWLQTLADVYEIRRLKQIQSIFDQAFEAVIKADDPDLEVDRTRGEITLKADALFSSGRFTFRPGPESRVRFERVRGHIAEILDQIEHGFESSGLKELEGLKARDHVDVVVVGHTDCIPFGRGRELRDNWDLSTLRAVSLASFLTEECTAADDTRCCSNGSQNCDDAQKTRRVATSWRILPAGRGALEPRAVGAEFKPDLWSQACTERTVPETIRRYQRRVVIQIVPRMDKLIVRDWDE